MPEGGVSPPAAAAVPILLAEPAVLLAHRPSIGLLTSRLLQQGDPAQCLRSRDGVRALHDMLAKPGLRIQPRRGLQGSHVALVDVYP